jgi:hypothetical protein
MGLFDTVILNIECPFCGETSECDIQTKDSMCMMETLKKGDIVQMPENPNFLTGIGSCKSPKCKKHTIEEIGYWDGIGRMFDVEVFLENDRINGEYETIIVKI